SDVSDNSAHGEPLRDDERNEKLNLELRGVFLLLTSHFQVLLLSLLHPALDVSLLARAHGECTWRNVFANRGPRADVGAFANRDRRTQLRGATDECAVLDRGDLLPDAVVVARDGPGPDVHTGS